MSFTFSVMIKSFVWTSFFYSCFELDAKLVISLPEGDGGGVTIWPTWSTWLAVILQMQSTDIIAE